MWGEGLILKVVSLLIALILWVAVIGGKKVEIGVKVPIEILLPKEMLITNNIPTEINFRISGPRAYLNALSKSMKPITVDLTGAKSGPATFKIHEDLIDLPLGLKVSGFHPSFITIVLEKLAMRDIPVKLSLSGSPPKGFRLRSASVDPQHLAISGPSWALEKVTLLHTETIDITNLTEPVEKKVKVFVPGLGQDTSKISITGSGEVTAVINIKGRKK